ncbi:MFS transporter [Reticulibacter mediterranei]|uniref:MFS transporter n=1 Tax=Reticulibacter mediterranei TaxID=2778369 RepID=A0A8J3N5M3_9CHLR|nr:MFS transporter [Reticulibacter mediterranei]GHO95297.1 MFS transporter [Reticulibacter mediterranei]
MHWTNNEYEQEIHSDKEALVSAKEPVSTVKAHDPYFALRFRDFRLFLIASFVGSLGTQMVYIAIGWELYERSDSALVLGGVGLAQVLPVILLSLPAGHIADRFHRQTILVLSQALAVLTSLWLAWLSYTHSSIALVYACLALGGVAMAFNGPAAESILAHTVPEEAYTNASTWASSSWQLASVVGPTLGGFAIAVFRSATPVYALNTLAGLIITYLLIQLRVRQRPVHQSEPQTTLSSLAEGLRFLSKTQVILAAITLDLFAVLFGGATTLLPIYAQDILHVGPTGLGWLRAAPSIGALVIAFILTRRPPFKKAGRTLLLAVAGFGAATIIFGISRSFWLSLAMLFVLGGLDNISVVIRNTLLLVRTPDAMRGRVSAVNALFVTASNELGGFESGLAAQFLGPVVTVAGGGVGTILVVILVALLWPEMRRLGTLIEPKS